MSFRKYSIVCVCILSACLSSASFATACKGVWVSGGENHSMVVVEDALVFAAGDNSYGQLGRTGQTNVFAQVLRGEMTASGAFIENISAVSAGWQHSLVLSKDMRVLAFGDNSKGELGNGTISDSPTPVWVHAGQQNPANEDANLCNIAEVSAGRSGTHSLAVDANGFVFAWGNDNKGQCGVGTSGSSWYTRPRKVLPGEMGGDFLRGIIAVSAGEEHSMALTADGFVYTWGDNVDVNGDKGKLGVNDANNWETTPVRVHGVDDEGYLPNIVAISAGWDHCMALEEYFPIDENKKGRVYTWGNNSCGYYGHAGGRLGDGTTTDSGVPVAVHDGDMNTPSGKLERIVAISAGESHCLVLDIEGKVWA